MKQNRGWKGIHLYLVPKQMGRLGFISPVTQLIFKQL